MRLTTVLATFLAVSCATTLLGDGFTVENSSFENEGPDGSITSYSGLRGGGNSAAMGWTVFNNTDGQTITELVETDGQIPGAGDRMLYVRTSGAANGVGHTLLPFDTGPKCAQAGVWVYVVSGTVILGLGNGGNTGPLAFSTTAHQWEYLEAVNQVCPANQFIIYSWNGPAEWFADLGEASPVMCPLDLDNDGVIGTTDLLFLLSEWGEVSCARSDFNDDGNVDVTDLLTLIAAWSS